MNKNSPSLIKNSSSASSQQSQEAHDHPISINSVTVESVKFSVQKLVKNWNRRQQWKKLISSIKPKKEGQGQDHDNHDGHDQQMRLSWRTKLENFLESKQVRLAAIFLLLVDIILTTIELSKSLLSCEKSKNKMEGHHEKWYHWMGIAILGLLSARIAALAVGLGASFFRRPGHVVDGVVVVGALLLEGFLERKGGGLLVVVSLWRVVRVVESAFELSDDAIEAQIQGVVRQFEALRQENSRLLEIVDEKDKIVQKLLEDLDQCRQANSCTTTTTSTV